MIKIETFKAGIHVKRLDYKAFSPTLIDTGYHWEDRELTRMVEQAALALGQLDAYGDMVPDIDHFIRMYVTKEATLSSKIEGTQTIMDDALLAEQDIMPDRRDDWREVQNYISAMHVALQSLSTLPITSRLLCQVHKVLLHEVRGANKLPGEFRRSQNWIGGLTIKTAAFVPPVHDDVGNLMSDLEKFLHNEDTGLTEVMKIALAHYQFKTPIPGWQRADRAVIDHLVSRGKRCAA
jgi:Fic family protein